MRVFSLGNKFVDVFGAEKLNCSQKRLKSCLFSSEELSSHRSFRHCRFVSGGSFFSIQILRCLEYVWFVAAPKTALRRVVWFTSGRQSHCTWTQRFIFHVQTKTTEAFHPESSSATENTVTISLPYCAQIGSVILWYFGLILKEDTTWTYLMAKRTDKISAVGQEEIWNRSRMSDWAL